MKENQTVCPCCGQSIDKSPGWPFWEMWYAEWHRQMKCWGFYAKNPNFGETYGLSKRGTVIPKPIPLIQWEMINPEPQTKLNDYVLKLAQKVIALETAFVKKGGSR